MTLDEAIKHCEDVANRERELYKMCPEDCDGSSDCRELKHGKDRGCLKCAEEHEQLAEWLKELKRYREADIPRLQWEKIMKGGEKMDNKEAIKRLKEVQAEFNENWVDFGGINEAFKKAYQALEEQSRGAESHLDNTPTVAINKDFYKTDKSNPINRSDLFQ